MYCFSDTYFTESEQFLMQACGLRPLGAEYARFRETRLENLTIRVKLLIGKNWEGVVSCFHAVYVYRSRDRELLCENQESLEFASVAEALNHLGDFAGTPTWPPVRPALPHVPEPGIAVH